MPKDVKGKTTENLEGHKDHYHSAHHCFGGRSFLGKGDDRGEPILIKTANTTKEVWCPFYADKVAIKAANVFERIYAEVKAAYEENSAFAKFDTLNHEEKMCEISSYVMHNFENILKEIEDIPGVQNGKY